MPKQDDALADILRSRFHLSPTRAETLSWLVRLLPQQGSVCMYRLAAHVKTTAKIDSTRQRFRRFFERTDLDAVAEAKLIAEKLRLCGKQGWHLALDRTNWDFGETTHNILVLSVLWQGSAVPLFRIMLDKKGNSDTSERENLLQMLLDVFPDQPIASLTGDREFIGHRWLQWLTEKKIPFVMRHRENMYVSCPNQAPVLLSWMARDLKIGETMNLKGGCRIGKTKDDSSPPVFVVMRRLKTGELLILASSYSAKKALKTYVLRWKIETLFGLLKTKGFNLEDTHMKDPKRLSTLFGILAIAGAMVLKIGQAVHRHTPIPIKKHGRPARSLFGLGLDYLRRLFSNSSLPKIITTLARLILPEMSANLLVLLDVKK